MYTFFHGWRRKAGIAILVIAISEWVAIAQSKAIRTDGIGIEATFLTLLSAYLLLWKRRKQPNNA